MKDNGTVRVIVRDILNTQRPRAEIKYGNVAASFQERRNSRLVNLGFTYRFSKGKMGAQRKKTAESAGEEQNRIAVE